MSRDRSFTTLAYLSPRPALHRGASRKAQWRMIGSWGTAIALSASLALVVAASTPSASHGQQDVELGYDTPEQWEEGAVPAEQTDALEEIAPGEWARRVVVELEMPDGTVLRLSGWERPDGQPIEGTQGAPTEFAVDAPEPEPVAPEIEKQVEALTAAHEAMAEEVVKEPVLFVEPLKGADIPPRMDSGDRNPDRANVVASQRSEEKMPALAEPAVDPSIPVREPRQEPSLDPLPATVAE